MDKLKNLFKDKDPKVILNIVGLLALGIILLIMGNMFGSAEEKTPAAADNTQPANEDTDLSYERELEKRLAAILSQADGAGKVEVMIKLSLGREIVVGEDTSTDIARTKEIDSAGGSRETYTESQESQTIIINDGKSDVPLILKQIEPKIEGVIIIAEGGGEVTVKDALIKAAQTVLGVEPHKVQVLKMKGEE